jgi:hypothetical protein
VATELKEFAKRHQGSSWAVDRRGGGESGRSPPILVTEITS